MCTSILLCQTFALSVNEINPVLKRSKVQRDIASEQARIAKEARHMRLEEMQRYRVDWRITQRLEWKLGFVAWFRKSVQGGGVETEGIA